MMSYKQGSNQYKHEVMKRSLYLMGIILRVFGNLKSNHLPCPDFIH
jgi:hypothetical protein